jgi:hypothetical protein
MADLMKRLIRKNITEIELKLVFLSKNNWAGTFFAREP